MELVPIEQDGSVRVAAEDRSGSLASVSEMTLALYARRGFELPWVCYLAVEHGVWVGTCGFAGPPASGEAEIAYFTFPGEEGRGVASHMAAQLLALTRARAVSLRLAYIAHTLAQESASTSILRRLGFTLLGAIVHPEDGTVWKWRKSEVV